MHCNRLQETTLLIVSVLQINIVSLTTVIQSINESNYVRYSSYPFGFSYSFP